METLKHLILWKLGLAAASTQTTNDERTCLAKHVKDKHRVVEIGVWHGVTSKVLLNAMPKTAIFFAVDPYFRGRLGFSCQEIIAHSEVKKVNGAKVEWIKSTGEKAASIIQRLSPGLVDFVFIDGNHSYDGLRADWNSWSSLISSSGIVALHDSRSHADRNIEDAGSVIFTREVVIKDERFEVVDCVDSLTILMRRP